MNITAKKIQLKNGIWVLLRSPEVSDAPAVAEHRRTTSEETYFMARYPEELENLLELTQRQLAELREDPKVFGISAFLGEQLIADCRVSRPGAHIKFRHRACFGISIRKEFWDLGLGSILLEEAVRVAAENGFEQLELGVFADNPRAIHVYEKAGFQKVGIQPRAFKLKDGTYRDEIQMVRFL